MISPLVQNVSDSPTLLINQETNRLISAGQKIIKLGFGQSPFPVPAPVVAALKNQAHQKDYLPRKGLYELRESIAQYCNQRLQLSYNFENISIGPGSKELLYGLQMAYDGDLIIPAPSWVSYAPQAAMLGKKIWWIDTHEKDNWLLQAEQLDQVCQNINNPHKLLILNYPNNPTGTSFNLEQMQALIPVFKKHQILLLADEIYHELHFGSNPPSFAQLYPEGTILSSGLSKWCGAGGWRLGYFAFPDRYRKLQDTMAAIASETFSAVSAPIQWAAIKAFEHNDEIKTYLEKSRTILAAIANYSHKSLAKLHITAPAGAGGFYLFPNFEYYRATLQKKGINDSEELCQQLLAQTGIALLPGSAFGRPSAELTTRFSYVDFDGQAALDNLPSPSSKINDSYLQSNIPNIILAMKRLSDWLVE